MVMRPLLSAIFAGFTGLTGCFPAVQTTVPALKGTVVDLQGRPVPLATVEVSRRPGRVGRVFNPVQFQADADGRFEQKERSRWVLHVIPGDVYGPDLEVTARASGAASLPRDVPVRPGVRLFGLGAEDRVDVGALMIPTSVAPR